jgi:uncharacterized protein YegL
MTTVNVDGGQQVLPFYILCDESMSMDGPKLDAVNQGLSKLHIAVASDPIVNDKVRVGVISFSDTAEELVPLTKLAYLPQMPGLVSKGGTSYTAAFTVAKSAIDRDVANLKSSGLQVLRPVIFFISDGEPTSPDWPTAHAALTSPNNPYAPHILAFGITGAIGQVIKEVATDIKRLGKKFAWLADDGTDPGAVVKEIISKLVTTIIASGRSQNPVLVPPTPPVGVIDLDPV